jgi:hypothetical protein
MPATWTREEVLGEIADLWELDTGRDNEGWTVWVDGRADGEVALQLGEQVFVVSVEKVRG